MSLLSWFRHKRDPFHCRSLTCGTCDPYYASYSIGPILEPEVIGVSNPMLLITEQI